MLQSYLLAGAGFGVLLVLFALVLKKRLKFQKEVERASCIPVQVVHRLCPHHNVVQGFPVEQKDSLDEHLDVLTRKLAEREGRLRLSKSKIRETQHEIDNLHAIDQNVRFKYREIMDSLKTDLISNEKECLKLQDQIEWASRRRAELTDEVHRGQKLYGEAAADLASNLSEMQRGRTEHYVYEKPYEAAVSLRNRKEPQLPRPSPIDSFVMKNQSSYHQTLDHSPQRECGPLISE